jgi:hypothetical protein
MLLHNPPSEAAIELNSFFILTLLPSSSSFFQVQQKGMRDETLDALGIMTPMHRSLLTYFEPRSYSNDIEVGTYSVHDTFVTNRGVARSGIYFQQ